MINIVQNDSVINSKLNDNTIIFTDVNNMLKIKKHYVNTFIKVSTLDNYVNTLVGNKYNLKLIDNDTNYIYMLEAFYNVKDSLLKYNNVNDLSFINKLIETYEVYKENNLLDNDKIKSLTVIFNEYEKLLELNNYMTKYKMYELINNCIDNISYKDIIFENINSLKTYEIDFINNIKDIKNVTIYANSINNKSLVDDLSITYEETNNSDINNLYKIGSNNLFSNDKIVSCNDLYEEIRYVSRDIKKNINNGLKFKDILVVSSDINRYSNYLKMLFDFPYYKKEETGVLTRNFLNVFIKILKGDFRCKNFVNLLKLNLFDTDFKLVNKLDNYVYTYSLEDELFYKEFTINPSGRKDNNTYDEKLLNDLNSLREDIINPIRVLLGNIVNEKNTKNIIKYLFIYIDEEGISDKLNKLDHEGYNKLVDLLETINDNLTINDINVLLNLIDNLYKSSNKSIHNIDEVNIMSLDNYVDNSYKKTYFIGVTGKDIPGKFTIGGLIDKNDIDSNSLFDLINRHNDIEKNIISNILLNDNVTITYHKLDDKGSKLEPSSLLNKFSSKKESYTYSINSNNIKDFNLRIDSNCALELYGNNLYLSPSGLEMYAKCPYSYFLSYGLKLKEKEKKTFDNREVGTFVHYILEKCINDNVTHDNCNYLVDKYTDLYFKDKVNNNTLKYVINSIKESTVMLIHNILNELYISKFKPTYTELSLKDIPINIMLNKGVLNVSGIVDRVDSYEDDNNYYYRIIDYKTGTKKFRLDDVLNGLNMQMIVYLMNIKNSDITSKNIVPTGFLYKPALVKYKKENIGTDDLVIEKNINDSLKMNGIINKDNLDLYDEDEISNYIDVTSRGKLSFDKVLDTKELNSLFDKVKSILKGLGDNILDGNIMISPIIDNKNDSCKYCKYSSICKFNHDNDKPRRYKSLTKNEVMTRIEGDTNGMD